MNRGTDRQWQRSTRPALPCSWRATFRRSWSGISDTSEWPLGTARSSFGHAHHSDRRTRLGWELAQTRKSLDEVREALRELQAAVLARQKAEAEPALYRERDIARARAAVRDPAAPLQ